jgi:DNA-nicking Smr family endonuclease
MASDKDLMINDKEISEDVEFGDLLGEGVEPLKGKGAHRSVAPVKITPGIEARRKAAQLDQVKELNELDSVSVIPQVDPHDILSFIRPGIQHGVFKNLRQGKYEIQSMLDLHRHTVEQARQALWMFINDCHVQGVRCAIVTHGKGEGREHPARLKSCVNHWLRQIDYVLGFHSAQKQHGGAGATYVLIKKSSQARRRTGDRLDRDGRARK